MNRTTGLLTMLAAVAAAIPVQAGRYEDLTRWAAEGTKMNLAAATYVGTASPESLVAVVPLPDASIMAVGNAYGPAFFTTKSPRILGKGSHSGVDPFEVQQGRKVLKAYTPDMCGMLIALAPDLQSVRQIVRFQWGVATITAAALSQDRKALILGGYCSPDALKDVVPAATLRTFSPAGVRAPRAGPAPAYIMRLALGDAPQAEWCWILPDASRPPEELWQDRLGNVCVALDGFTRIRADGSVLEKLTSKGNTGGQSGLRGFDPMDGGYFYGGDRNTHTGQQPWRQPFLDKYTAAGEKAWSLWGWDPRKCACGGSGNGLCANSSIRDVQVASNGDMIVLGWSEGGNSVFTRQPYSLEQGAGNSSSPFMTAGQAASGPLAYVMRVDSRTRAQTAWSCFLGYLPDTFATASLRGAPSGIQVDALRVLPDNAVALTGEAGTGLICTPNAFCSPRSPSAYGGRFASVLSQDFSQLLFSSYLPGYETAILVPVEGGLLVAGTTRRDDGRTDPSPSAPPVKNALQPDFAGGEFDGHILLLTSPRMP
jgi:hypothetical protein